jgi:hypothetical protein
VIGKNDMEMVGKGSGLPIIRAFSKHPEKLKGRFSLVSLLWSKTVRVRDDL